MNVGDFVDDFEAIDQHGTQHQLSEMLAEAPLVLYFYPEAFTPGCTRESCHFRDVAAERRARGAQVIGISGHQRRGGREHARRSGDGGAAAARGNDAADGSGALRRR